MFFSIQIVIISLVFSQSACLECFKCSTSSRYANKDCVYGYSSLHIQECPSDYVCSVYQYEISIHRLIKSSVTIRGCQPLMEVQDDCKNLLKDIRQLLYPARIREKNCFSCKTNLCNTHSNIE